MKLTRRALWCLLVLLGYPACTVEPVHHDEPDYIAPDCTWICRSSGLCEDRGVCECVTGSECYLDGERVEEADCCVATSYEHCSESRNCKFWGLCTLGYGYCVAGSDADCAQSEFCSAAGYCTDCGGYCGPVGC